MGLFDKLVSKVKSITSPKLLDPKADKTTMPQLNTANARLPDGSTTNPATKTGYKWANTILAKPSLTPSPTLMPSTVKNTGMGNTAPLIKTSPLNLATTKKQEKVPANFYDAAEKYGAALGVPKEVILANSRWEHRNNKGWNEGKYVDNVWWNQERNTGEESYGPGQINMRWFGPKALELGRNPGDLFITPEDAKDQWKAAEWMAKKFSKEAQKYINKGLEPDWEAILQGYNSGEADRGKNVKNLIDSTDFVRN